MIKWGGGIRDRMDYRVNTTVGNPRDVYGKSPEVVIGAPIHLNRGVQGVSYGPLGQLWWDSKLGEEQMG